MNSLSDITLTNEAVVIIEQQDKLIDEHMLQFMKLLNHEMGFETMQDPILIQILDFIRPINRERRHIQILFCESRNDGHWICIWYDSEKVYVYDSTNATALHSDCRRHLNRLRPFNPEIVMVKVKGRQMNSDDCGVYATAFATSLRFGISPQNLCFRRVKMRTHLLTIFRERRLRQFPLEPCDGENYEHDEKKSGGVESTVGSVKENVLDCRGLIDSHSNQRKNQSKNGNNGKKRRASRSFTPPILKEVIMSTDMESVQKVREKEQLRKARYRADKETFEKVQLRRNIQRIKQLESRAMENLEQRQSRVNKQKIRQKKTSGYRKCRTKTISR